jgi:hypothetical protein
MVFDSMAENYSPKTKEAIDSCEELLFKGIKLISNKSILKIALQFFRSISNNLKNILFTTQSSNVSMQGDEFKNINTHLLSDLEFKSLMCWTRKIGQFSLIYNMPILQLED